METKAQYIITVANPAGESLSTASLATLQVMKRQYLDQGEEQFDNLALIVATFGSEIEIRKRFYRVWQRGRITALFSIDRGRYLPDVERYEETQVLSIFLDCNGLKDLDRPDRLQVVYLRKGDAVIADEQRFVPGQWLSAMLSELPAAMQVAREIDNQQIEAARAALAKELLIGWDI